MFCVALGVCVQTTLGLGWGHATPQDSGIYWMAGPQYSHSMNMSHVSERVELSLDRWRLGFDHLGTFRIDATARALESDPPSVPISHWHGQGRVWGVWAAYALPVGPVSVLVGPWVYRATWHETIPDWATAGSGPPRAGDQSFDHWNLGGLVGLEWSAGPLALDAMLRTVQDRGSGELGRSGLKNFYGNVTLGWRF
jgi:hypothetical protein